MGKSQPTVKLVQQLRLRRFARTDFSQHPEGHGAGDPDAADHLLPMVYEELRQLAAHRLTHEEYRGGVRGWTVDNARIYLSRFFVVAGRFSECGSKQIVLEFVHSQCQPSCSCLPGCSKAVPPG